MVAEYYPLAGCDHCNKKRAEERSSSDKRPMTTEDLTDIASLIKHVISDMTNDEIDVQVIEHGPDGPRVFGVNPNDYKEFKDFFKAVIKARKQFVGDAIKKAKMSTQEEATIHTATETAESISSDSKSPSSNGSEKGPKRRPSSKDDEK
jgi:hypothetical protein